MYTHLDFNSKGESLVVTRFSPDYSINYRLAEGKIQYLMEEGNYNRYTTLSILKDIYCELHAKIANATSEGDSWETRETFQKSKILEAIIIKNDIYINYAEVKGAKIRVTDGKLEQYNERWEISTSDDKKFLIDELCKTYDYIKNLLERAETPYYQ
jgi:hypothetical protein